MSEQKKIDLSALNKKNIQKENNESWVVNNVEIVNDENNNNKIQKNKKLNEKMKEIINWEFIEKTEQEAENKIKDWKDEILSEQKTKAINVEVNKNSIIDLNSISLPKDNQKTENLESTKIKENLDNNLEIENKKDENLNIDDKKNELFSNYKTDLDKEIVKEKVTTVKKTKSKSKKTIFYILFIFIFLISIWFISYMYKDKIKDIVWIFKKEEILNSWTSITQEKNENISSWVINEKENTSSWLIDEKNNNKVWTWNIEEKVEEKQKETVILKWKKFEVEYKNKDSWKIYFFDGKEFKDLVELKKYINEKIRNENKNNEKENKEEKEITNNEKNNENKKIEEKQEKIDLKEKTKLKIIENYFKK